MTAIGSTLYARVLTPNMTNECFIFDDTLGMLETELETSVVSPLSITDSSASPQSDPMQSKCSSNASPTGVSFTADLDSFTFDFEELQNLQLPDSSEEQMLEDFSFVTDDTTGDDLVNDDFLSNLLWGVSSENPPSPANTPQKKNLFFSQIPDEIVTVESLMSHQLQSSMPLTNEHSYCGNSTGNIVQQKASDFSQGSSGDFSIEMDDDESDTGLTYSPQSQDNPYNSSSSSSRSNSIHKKQTSSGRPYRSARPSGKVSKQQPLLPYTVHDLPKSNALNNEDIIKGKPGERLILTEEEKRFLTQEGFPIPTHLPLTKDELRALKTVRRKIRNKISAKNSRAKKQDYVAGLEQRVTICTEENAQLKKRLKQLEATNRNLLGQVRHLRDTLASYMPNGAGTKVASVLNHNGVANTSLCLCMVTFLVMFVPYFLPGLSSILSSPTGLPPGAGDNMALSVALAGLGTPSVNDHDVSTVAPASQIPGGRRLLQESDLAQDIGDPYDITIRPTSPLYYPPKSPNLNLPSKETSSVFNLSHHSTATLPSVDETYLHKVDIDNDTFTVTGKTESVMTYSREL